MTTSLRADSAADSIAGDLPEAALALRKHPNSITLLDEANPYMQVMAKLSIAAGIPYHQIIARKDRTVPLERSSDGLVPYQSSYVAGAESTLIVESGHHVQDTVPAILEIRRILLLHAAAHPDSVPRNLLGGADRARRFEAVTESPRSVSRLLRPPIETPD